MKKVKMKKPKNPFTDLLDNLIEGKLGHNQIQIAYRAWIRQRKDLPDAIKDVVGGSGNKAGILYKVFSIVNQCVGGMDLVWRRGYQAGFEDGQKSKKRKKKCQRKKQP